MTDGDERDDEHIVKKKFIGEEAAVFVLNASQPKSPRFDHD